MLLSCFGQVLLKLNGSCSLILSSRSCGCCDWWSSCKSHAICGWHTTRTKIQPTHFHRIHMNEVVPTSKVLLPPFAREALEALGVRWYQGRSVN